MIKKSARVISIQYLFGSFIFFLAVSFFASCENDIKTVNQFVVNEKIPNESSKDVEILYSDSGKVKMKLISKKANRFDVEHAYVEFPIGLNMLFYNDSMHVKSTLKADYGIRHQEDGKMEVRKKVEVINVKGEKLNTEYLIYDEEKNRIYTNEFVTITTKDEVMYGDGLESNRDFTRYKIMNIKGIKNIEDNP